MSEWGGEQREQKLSKAEKRRLRKSRKGEERSLEPPALPPPAESKARRVLYVGCEGETTEPDYLNYLNDRFGDAVKQPFRIQPVYTDNGLIPSRAVAAVRKYAPDDETWVLFDRDRHHDIPQALREAAEDGTEVCFSHPSFDLWLLLHFTAFGGSRSGDSSHVTDKLRQADAAYRRFARPSKNVQGDRRTALDDKECDAITNARSLVNQCEHGDCKADRRKVREPRVKPPFRSPAGWSARSGHSADCQVLDRDPSTDVWRLLVSLGIGKPHH